MSVSQIRDQRNGHILQYFKDPPIIWLVDSGLLKYSSGLQLLQRLLVTARHIRLSRAASGLQSVWLCNHNWARGIIVGQTEQTFTLTDTYTLLVNG